MYIAEIFCYSFIKKKKFIKKDLVILWWYKKKNLKVITEILTSIHGLPNTPMLAIGPHGPMSYLGLSGPNLFSKILK